MWVPQRDVETTLGADCSLTRGDADPTLKGDAPRLADLHLWGGGGIAKRLIILFAESLSRDGVVATTKSGSHWPSTRRNPSKFPLQARTHALAPRA
eukprot:CAMPEP_0194517994 /NCGR_PEP_ID=MMETSP0253-20130528/51322_1 /TAXON_ID=2966 /ORGANISM="Noctiluca scintillans" /LENGTH=95 /DNA_ID=CAMNT_0039362013 /DNA_START=187 /DNA_END=475 /DNA_ORIENTATION=-